MAVTTGNPRDNATVFNTTYWPAVSPRTTLKHLSTRHYPPVLITSQVCCSKSTTCEHSSSTVALVRGWQILLAWLSSNRHRIVAPPCCSRNPRNTIGDAGLAV